MNVKRIIIRILVISAIVGLIATKPVNYVVIPANLPITVFKLVDYKINEDKGEILVGDFESGLDNWENGIGVADLKWQGDVTAKPLPVNGDNLLIVYPLGSNMVSTPRTVFKKFKQPLNIGENNVFVFSVDSYGYKSEYQKLYQLNVKFYDVKGNIKSYIIKQPCEPWDKVGIDISNWDGRKSISKIEIASYINSPVKDMWAGVYFLDYIGFVKRTSEDLKSTLKDMEIKDNPNIEKELQSMSSDGIKKLNKERISHSLVIMADGTKYYNNGRKFTFIFAKPTFIEKDGYKLISLNALEKLFSVKSKQSGDKQYIIDCGKSILFKIGSYKAITNEVEKVYNVPPVIENNMLYVSFNDIIEDMGLVISEYDGFYVINSFGSIFDTQTEKILIKAMKENF